MKRILFYPMMTNGKKPDQFMDDYNPISEILVSHRVPHWLINKSVHKSFNRIVKQHKPTDVVFRMPGLRQAEIAQAKKLHIRTHTIQHGWPVKSIAHVPIGTDRCYVWSKSCKNFYAAHDAVSKNMIITGSPRYDKFFHKLKNKTYNRVPVIGFSSIPYYIWKAKDDVKQAMFYAKIVNGINHKAFPEIIQRLHPHEQTNGWLSNYEKVVGPRTQFEDPYSRSILEFYKDIDILVTTQSGTIIEAAMLGIPCVSMLFFNKQQYVTDDRYPISIHITDHEDLEEALIKAYGLRGIKNDNAKYYHAYFDGLCAKRIVDCLLQ